MLKTLGAQVKEFKKASIATPLFMILEVIMEIGRASCRERV